MSVTLESLTREQFALNSVSSNNYCNIYSHYYNNNAARLRNRLISGLGSLRQKPSSFENFGCIALHLPRFPVIEIKALSIQKNLDH